MLKAISRNVTCSTVVYVMKYVSYSKLYRTSSDIWQHVNYCSWKVFVNICKPNFWHKILFLFKMSD